jgi:hypothetical protein
LAVGGVFTGEQPSKVPRLAARKSLAWRLQIVTAMRRWLSALVIGTVAPSLALGSGAVAQTKSMTSAPAFDKLSLGNQKVAASLYQAQTAGTSPTGSPIRPLTLQQIASKRLSGQSWGQIFREMKAQGLVQEKSLSQVVSRYGQVADSERGTTATSASRASAAGGAPLEGASYGNGLGSR